MIFNEVYGCYYNAVSKIIENAIDGELTDRKLNDLSKQYAFEESNLTIVPSIKNQQWQLIDENMKTPILNKPRMPLTMIEKRWLKTISNDSKFKLFNENTEKMDNIEPLYNSDDIVYFDRYTDGDDFESPVYIEKFRNIVYAIENQLMVKVKYKTRKNPIRKRKYCPIKIEYSDKDDKFRVICGQNEYISTLNIDRIVELEVLDEHFNSSEKICKKEKNQLILEIIDERNALERVMMKFACYKKQVERVSDDKYLMTMDYNEEDETDILIQIMNFGSLVNIKSPSKLKIEMRNRLKKQIEMLNW